MTCCTIPESLDHEGVAMTMIDADTFDSRQSAPRLNGSIAALEVEIKCLLIPGK